MIYKIQYVNLFPILSIKFHSGIFSNKQKHEGECSIQRQHFKAQSKAKRTLQPGINTPTD